MMEMIIERSFIYKIKMRLMMNNIFRKFFWFILKSKIPGCCEECSSWSQIYSEVGNGICEQLDQIREGCDCSDLINRTCKGVF